MSFGANILRRKEYTRNTHSLTHTHNGVLSSCDSANRKEQTHFASYNPPRENDITDTESNTTALNKDENV